MRNDVDFSKDITETDTAINADRQTHSRID